MKKVEETKLTEFQQFLYFRHKAQELDRLNEKIKLLQIYGHMNMTAIRKAMRISVLHWFSYLEGEEVLPDGFIERFEQRLKNKLKESQAFKHHLSLDLYSNLLPPFRDNSANKTAQKASTEEYLPQSEDSAPIAEKQQSTLTIKSSHLLASYSLRRSRQNQLTDER